MSAAAPGSRPVRRWRRRVALAALAAACRAAPPALEPVPLPALEGAPAEVRRQVEAARGELARDLEGRSPGRAITPQALAGAYGRLGRLYLAYELGGAAGACFRNAVTLEPGEHRWHYYRGVAAHLENRLQEAAVAFEHALERRPGDPPTLLRLADLEQLRGNPERARELFESVLEQDPGSAVARFGLGRLDAAAGRPRSAIEHFQAALAAQPQASAVRHALGLAHRDAGDLVAARRELAAGGWRRPDFEDPLLADLGDFVRGARAHLSRGSEARRRGELEAAAEHFRRAAELAPGDAAAQYNLGAVLGELGRHEEARTALTAAVDLDPTLTDAWLNLGTALARSGRWDEAAAAFGRVLELTPGEPVASLRRALAWRRLGRGPQALVELERLAAASPGSPELLFQLALSRIQQGQYAAARQLLEGEAAREAAGEVPGRLATHLLARLLATCPAAAVRDGRQALDLARELFAGARSVEHGRTVAMALAELGRFDEARRWQAALLAEAERAGAPEALRQRLRRELEAYGAGRPVRAPWRVDEEGGAG